MTAMFPSEATVTIAAAGAASSAASATSFTAYVTNFTHGGGESETESIPVFGGGNIEKEMPREQIEVSFEAIIQYGSSSSLLFDQLLMGSTLDGSTSVDSSQEAVGKAIYVQLTDGTNYYTRAYNNAKAVSFEPEMSADEYMKGTITFKLTPTTSSGSANMKVVAAVATSVSW